MGLLPARLEALAFWRSRQSLKSEARRRMRRSLKGAGAEVRASLDPGFRMRVNLFLEDHQTTFRTAFPLLVLALSVLGKASLIPLGSNPVAEAKSTLSALLQFVGSLVALLVPLLIVFVEFTTGRRLRVPPQVMWSVVGLRSAVLASLLVLGIEFVAYIVVGQMPQALLPGLVTGAALAAIFAILPLAVSTYRVIRFADPEQLRGEWRDRIRWRLVHLRKWEVETAIADDILAESVDGFNVWIGDAGYGSGGVERTARESETGRYVKDLNLGWLLKWIRVIHSNDPEARLYLPTHLGDSIFQISTLAELVPAALPQDRAQWIVDRLPAVLRLSNRHVSSPRAQVQNDVRDLVALAHDALDSGEMRQSAEFVDELGSHLLHQLQYTNSAIRSASLHEAGSRAGSILLQATQSEFVDLFEDAVARGSEEVLLGLTTVWYRLWLLAGASGDRKSLNDLVQTAGWLTKIVGGVQGDVTRLRVQKGLLHTPWETIQHLPAYPGINNGAPVHLARGAILVRAVISSAMDILRQSILDGDAGRLGYLSRELEKAYAGTPSLDYGLSLPFVPPGDDLYRGLAEPEQRLDELSDELFRLAMGMPGAWAFDGAVLGRTTTDLARQALNLARNYLGANTQSLIAVLRHSTGAVWLFRDYHNDWQWELWMGAYTVPRFRSWAVWPIIVDYVAQPKPQQIEIPKLYGRALFSEPRELFGPALDQAIGQADRIAEFLRPEVQIDSKEVRARLDDLRKEVDRWEAGVEQQRAAWLRSQPLDTAAIRRLEELVDSTFQSQRRLGALFQAEVIKADASQPGPTPIFSKVIMPRAAFIMQPTVDAGAIDQALGAELVKREDTRLTITLSDVSLTVAVADGLHFEAEVEEVVNRLREAGYEPGAILFSSRTQLLLSRRESDHERSERFAGIRLIEVSGLGDWQVLIVDPDRAGTLGVAPDPETRRLTRTTVTDGPDAPDPQVTFETELWSTLRVKDVNAVRLIRLDTPLTRNQEEELLRRR